MSYLLPRGYISWSQLEIFRKSPDNYVHMYIEGGKRLDTKYTRFGRKIHQDLEDLEDGREKEIRVNVNGVPILSYIDHFDETTGIFRDTKTGKTPWTQVKVQKHDQLVFYAMAIKHSTGITPKECYIDWIGTRDAVQKEMSGLHNKQPEVELTGESGTFKREITEKEIERMERELVEVAEKISNTYKKWINLKI